MELIKALAIALHEDALFHGAWPEPATEFTQDSSYGGEFDAEIPYKRHDGTMTTIEYYEFDGLPYLEEYESGDTVTKEEYEAFMAKNPNFYQDMIARRPFLIQEIARLNKVVGATIDEMSALADEAGVELTINLGQHGSLEVNSDWDSSRC